MLELPAQRKLRVPLGILAVDVGARQRVAVRTARLAGAALTGLQDDLGAAGLDLVVRAQYCLVVNSSATLAVSPLNLTGCLEKSKTAEAMTLPSSSLMLTLTSDSLNSAVSPSFVDAQLEVSCSCATRLASLWSTELSSHRAQQCRACRLSRPCCRRTWSCHSAGMSTASEPIGCRNHAA